MKKGLLITLLIHTTFIGAWSGDAQKDGHNLDFFGELTSRQGTTEKVNNIAFGRDRDSAKAKQISMYEVPKEYDQGNRNGLKIIKQDPKTSLIQSFIDLDEVSLLAVPHPQTIWRYTPKNSSTGYDYIEVSITAKNGDKTNYLLELGREGSRKPAKVFCSSVHQSKDVLTDEQAPLFCKGVRTDELEEKGVPLAAIKELKIEGYCHRKPVDAKRS